MPFKEQLIFKYEVLDRSEDSIRLCKLLPGKLDESVKCDLFHDTVSNLNGQYYALSYTWGMPTVERWIWLNGKRFMVQPNLLAALKAVRRQETTLILWIDAICINQLDGLERSYQVSLMGKIYSNAREVLVWLGPAEDNSDLLFGRVEKYFQRVRKSKENGNQKTDEVLLKDLNEQILRSALSALSQRPYWHRAWIKQEIILAKQITIYCGSRSVCGHDFLLWATMHVALSNAKNNIMVDLFGHRQDIEKKGFMTLEQLLYKYGRMQCTEPRDRVFSLYSLASECSENDGQKYPIVDYSISPPALFFALLGIFKPVDIMKFAATIQHILGVRRVALLNYWKKVETGVKCPVDSHSMENEARVFIMRVKKFRETGVCLKARELSLQSKTEVNTEFMADTIFQLWRPLFLDTRTSPIEEKLFMIENTNYYIIAKPTLFGLQFKGMLEDLIHPASGELKAEKIEASETIAALDPLLLKAFILFPETMLEGYFPLSMIQGLIPKAKAKELLEEMDFRSWEPNEILWRKDFISFIIGSELPNPSIGIICCILLELDRRAGLEGISLDDCRYILTALYGYELTPVTMRKREDSSARRILDSEIVAT